jgi:hypothetical protein
MERAELLEFLREHLTISLSMGREYESQGEYITARVSLQLDGEEITSDYSSVNIS